MHSILQIMGESTLKQKTASGLFWAALNNGAMQVLNAVIGIFLARLLTPADYGLVGLLTIFTAIATCIQEGGFTSALANIKHPTDNDYNSVFWFSSILGIVLYCILFFCAPLIADFFHQPSLTVLSRVVFLSIPLSAIGIAPSAYLFKNLIVKQATIQRIGVLTFSGVIGVVLAFKGMAYWSLVAQSLSYVGLQSLLKFNIIPWRPSLHIDFKPVRRMMSFSVKILITNIIQTINNNVLTVIFGRLFPVKIVGNFTQAYKWNNMASTAISGMLAQVTQPVLVAVDDEADRQLAILRKMIRFTAFLTFPCMFGLAIISKEFLVILISDKWLDAVPILQILCVSGAFFPIYNPLISLLLSHGKSDSYMWISLLQIALQTVLILLFAPYGILTMVAVYSCFAALWTFVWFGVTDSISGYKLLMFLKDTVPFLASAVLACSIAFFAGSFFHILIVSLLVKIVIAVIIYCAIMKIAHAKILDECINYILKKKR